MVVSCLSILMSYWLILAARAAFSALSWPLLAGRSSWSTSVYGEDRFAAMLTESMRFVFGSPAEPAVSLVATSCCLVQTVCAVLPAWRVPAKFGGSQVWSFERNIANTEERPSANNSMSELGYRAFTRSSCHESNDAHTMKQNLHCYRRKEGPEA